MLQKDQRRQLRMASTQYSLFGKKYLVSSYSPCIMSQIIFYIGKNKNEKSSFLNKNSIYDEMIFQISAEPY